MPLCAGTLRHLDISFCPELKSLDILTRALASVPVPDDDGDEEREYGLSKLVASGLALNAQTLVEYFRFASADGSDRRLSEQARRVARRTLRTLKLASIRGTRTTVGLDDAVLAKLLPYLAKFERLENVTLAGNMMLGRGTATLHSFFGLVGRRCKVSCFRCGVHTDFLYHHLQSGHDQTDPLQLPTSGISAKPQFNLPAWSQA